MTAPSDAQPTVTTTRQGHVLQIGLNRPAKRNAFNLAMINELAAAYELLGDDPDLRVGVLHGHGDHFSAGLDLSELAPLMPASGAEVLAGTGRYDPLGLWKPPVPKPVVMAASGISYTLSIELALASDIVVTADDVRFCQLEVARGLFPFEGGAFRAPAQLGWGNAMHFLLSAEEFGAEQALRIGLVQEVVPAGEHVDRALQIALATARAYRTAAEAAATEHIRAVLPEVLGSEDAQEGVRSFVEVQPIRVGFDADSHEIQHESAPTSAVEIPSKA